MRRERAAPDVACDTRDRDLEQRLHGRDRRVSRDARRSANPVVHSETNIGQNAYARGVPGDHLALSHRGGRRRRRRARGWDTALRDAFGGCQIGFLAADLEDDPHDLAAHYRYRVRPHEYGRRGEGVKLLHGPTGGGCAITSRELNERVGGFREDPKQVFWLEDETYIADIARLGYGAAVLADLRVHHTGGPYYRGFRRRKPSSGPNT